jgi:hypothetical protein
MERGTAWSRFRRWPLWVQVLIWVFLWPVPTALYAAGRPAGGRRVWWALTAVVTLAYGAAAIAGQPSPEDVVQAGDVTNKRSTTTTTSSLRITTSISAGPVSSTSGPKAAPAGGSDAGTTTTTVRPVPKPGTTSTTRPASPPTTTPAPGPTTRPTAPVGGADPLAALRVAPEGLRAGYDRDLFQHWIDADGNRCDTREEVLIAESRSPAQIDFYGCKVVAGDWFSAYDGVSIDQPGELDVDHVVALAEAWDSGASAWDGTRRRDFANDLGYAGSLIAVTASSNRSKSDHDPAGWMPPRRESWCSFATDWVAVKVRWNLGADQAEISALRNAFATCALAPPPPPPPVPEAITTTTTTTGPPPPATFPVSLVVSALDCGGERVKVTNGGGAAVGLDGWKIYDEGIKHTFNFPLGYSLAPGASVTIRSGGPAGAGELAWTGSSVWNNDGDTAHLINSESVVVSTRSC